MMIESLPEESLTDCFLAQSEVVMEGTTLLQLPEGMRLDQIQVTENVLIIEICATAPTSFEKAVFGICNERHYTHLLR